MRKRMGDKKILGSIELNRVYQMDCVEGMRLLPDESIDLTVTSPPYDNLRTYKGFSFDFERVARELYRLTKQGGVVVWIVNDATLNGSETCTSFKQVLYFKEQCGFKLHDTMIWNKGAFSAVGALQTRYAPVFDYMFVFTKGKIKTFNPINDRKNKHAGKKHGGTIRNPDGSLKRKSTEGNVIKDYGRRFNIWNIPPHRVKGNKHPAMFPVALARDHIISWSNQGDIVLDPFIGSGTTAVAAKKLNRHFIGFEIAEEYVRIANQRLEAVQDELAERKLTEDDEA